MISFFAKKTYLLTDTENKKDFLQRVSSRIRAEEISQYLGARLNQSENYENDVCIYVKPHSFNHIKDGSYVDVLDDAVGVKALKDRPGIKVIAMSQIHYEYLKQELLMKYFNSTTILISERIQEREIILKSADMSVRPLPSIARKQSVKSQLERLV
jgi:hypothetical protein